METKEMKEDVEAVYKKIVEDNLLKGIQRDVYEILYCSGSMTGGELACLYKDKYPDTDRNRNELSKRISDLVRLGVVEKSPEARKCPTTKKMISVWQLTGKLPVKPREKATVKQRLAKLDELEKALTTIQHPLAVALAQIAYLGNTRQSPEYGSLKIFYDKYCEPGVE